MAFNNKIILIFQFCNKGIAPWWQKHKKIPKAAEHVLAMNEKLLVLFYVVIIEHEILTTWHVLNLLLLHSFLRANGWWCLKTTLNEGQLCRNSRWDPQSENLKNLLVSNNRKIPSFYINEIFIQHPALPFDGEADEHMP